MDTGPSSSFTAVNHQWTQLPTPQSTASVSREQEQVRPRASAHSRRRHNPAVAQYLGLGNSHEPTHLEKYAPLPDVLECPPTSSTRKRRRLAERTLSNAGNTGRQDQRTVSQSFHLTKHAFNPALTPAKTSASALNPAQTKAKTSTHASQPTATKPTTSEVQTLRVASAYSPEHHTNLTVENPDTVLHHGHGTAPTRDIHIQSDNQDTVTVQPPEQFIDHQLFDLSNDEEDAYGSVQFSSDAIQPQVGGSDFDDSELDDALLMLTTGIDGPDNVHEESSSTVTSSTQSEDSDRHYILSSSADATTDVKEFSSPSRSQCVSRNFVSPVTPRTRLLAAACNASVAENWKPIVRSPFPEPVRDRSPIIGLSACTMLRTCFRIGEAVNQSCQATKSGKHITIELYARILNSDRTDTTQNFTFCDLFHAKPPYIKAVYEDIIWKPVQLFDYDSRRLLQEGRICRCIGTMKQEGKAWVMTVLNIWEATSEDIKWVEGIVNF
ncbi:hypothetical protein N0V83_000837 [Neocucurbitaria cava]|uniref:Uncharacterized protein n=1 Tax=Neocucurbitaria cava TaxID=798079 RepID=A0A9W9CSE1_9PLEO|nr:hypothetical protein N0V83_000837 [Neocucurbitaria cava]